MGRLMIAPVSILIVAAGAATLNFTFTVTSASITTSGTSVSVSGPATLTVSGVGSDSGTFSASGSLANVTGGNVTVAFTDTFGYGTLTGNMTFPEGVLVGSAPVSGSATITIGTGLYASLANTTVNGSGFSGSVLSGGALSFSVSGTANGRQFTFSVTNAPVTISGTTVFSGAASLTLGGNSPDTGTFSATASLTNISGGNLTVPFTVTLGQGTLTGNMTFPQTVLASSGPVSGSATITGGTGGYAGLTSSTVTASGTVTGSILSGGRLSFSISGAANTGGSSNTPIITNVVSCASYGIGLAGFSGTVITPIETGSWVTITGQSLASTTRIWEASDFDGLGDGLPISLDGVSVTINGKLAAVYYISPTQLNVQAPQDGALGSVPVVVTNSLGKSNSMNATLQQYAPGFFLLSQPGTPSPTAALYVAAVHTDGVVAVPANYYGSSVNSRPAKPGEALQIYGTGFGPTNPTALAGQLVNGAPPLADPSMLSITIGGVPATVLYAGLVVPGEYQLNVVVPQLPDGDQPIVATIGGSMSQTGVSVPVKN